MATTHSTAARNASANAVLALLNGGSANAAGIARFRAANDSIVAGLNLSTTAFAAAVNGTATANAISADTNAPGGTIAKLTLEDRDRAIHITAGDVRTTAGGDMQGNALNVTAGDTVEITSLQYAAPV